VKIDLTHSHAAFGTVGLWRNLLFQREVRFLALSARSWRDIEGLLRVELARSPSRQGRPAFCAKRT
jgi:hypothetical protein